MGTFLSSNLFILILLIICAVGQILGTVTVAFNYFRTGAIAKTIVDKKDAQLANIFWERAKITAIASELTGRWWLLAGLIAYVVSALAGLWAAIIGLYK